MAPVLDSKRQCIHSTALNRAAGHRVARIHLRMIRVKSFLDTFFERNESNDLISVCAVEGGPTAIIHNQIQIS